MADDPSGTPGSAVRPLRIGDWVLDAALNELRRDDAAVRLEPKAIELLAFLASRPGRVVGREALLAAVWPGVVVGDDSLTQAVIKLRRALGDDAQHPRYIETIPKRGYRLIAPVAAAEGPGPRPAAEGAAPAAPPRAAAGTDDILAEPALAAPAAAVPRTAPGRTRAIAAGLIGVAVLGLGAAWQLRPAGNPGGGNPEVREHAAPPTVAVLPLENLGGDRQREYFSDGVTQDIIAALGRFSTLRVMSLNAVVPFKAGRGAPAAVRAALGVRYVVSGSLRESEGRYRVAVELSDAEKGVVLWSGRFEGTGREIFEIQDRIVLQVAGALAGRVARLEQERALAKPPRDMVAYDQVLHARALLQNADRAANRQARALLEKAVRLAPAYAEAHVGLGQAEHQRAVNGWVEDPGAALRQAEDHLYRAIALDDPGAKARAHGELGMIHSARGQFEQALAEADAALDLNPNDAYVHDRRGITLMYLGRLDEALASMQFAARVDPSVRGLGSEFSLALATYSLRRYDDALRIAERALERYPGAPDLHAIRAAALARMDRRDEARQAVGDLRRAAPFFEPRAFASRFVDPALRAHAQEALKKAGA
ncbi:MAG: winged helix-turn-helix domain-containing protein [Rhodocyclaceae bacterium]|nr:winged helix-turn-helix domain-containing protein [Rhodocyclaceae bacterium]